MLKHTTGALWDEYDVAMLDLDGVVYVGSEAVPGAADVLDEAATAGMHVAYVTNNAGRPPEEVARHLRDLGIHARTGDVVTSAQAAARLVAGKVPRGASVYVIGGAGLFQALSEHGLEGVQDIEADPAAVVSGYHPDLRWGTVVDGAILVARGVPWVASNMDLTLPSAHGLGPGNGALVGVVARFAGREPEVAGKPEPPLFEETLRRVGGRRPLVVGDRLDTDIEGASRTGHDSLLVMTGVTGLADLAAAGPARRPSYISVALGGLGRPQPAPVADGDFMRLRGWAATVDGGVLTVTGQGDADDWWRVASTAAWRHLDNTGAPGDVSNATPPGTVAR